MNVKGDGLTLKRPVSIREQVYDHLKEQILSGRLPPEKRMVELQVANELGISRTPVRESLHILEREGLLEALPGNGYRVRPITWAEVEEICEIRAANETLAALWAMKRITPAELEALRGNIEAVEKEIVEGRPEAFVEADAEFHDLLARASGSERLVELCQMLRRHMLRYRLESLHEPASGRSGVEGHRRIFDCLCRKDEQSMPTAIRQHLEESKANIRRYAFDREPKTTPGE